MIATRNSATERWAAGLLALVSLFCYEQLALPYCAGDAQHSLPDGSSVIAHYPCGGSGLARFLYIAKNAPGILWDICRLKYKDCWASLCIPLLFVRWVCAFCLPPSVHGQLVVPFTCYSVRVLNTVFHVLQGPRFRPSAMSIASLFFKHSPFEVLVFLSMLSSWPVNIGLELAVCAWAAASIALLATWYAPLLPPGVTVRGQVVQRLLVAAANVYLDRLMCGGGRGRGGRGGRGRRELGGAAAGAAEAAGAGSSDGCGSARKGKWQGECVAEDADGAAAAAAADPVFEGDAAQLPALQARQLLDFGDSASEIGFAGKQPVAAAVAMPPPPPSTAATPRLPAAYGAALGAPAGSGPIQAPMIAFMPPYRSYTKRQAVRIKIPWAEPEDLAPGYQARMAALLASQGLKLTGAYVRRGCVELVLVVEEPPQPRGAEGTRGLLPGAGGAAAAAAEDGMKALAAGWLSEPCVAAPAAPRWALELNAVVEALGLVQLGPGADADAPYAGLRSLSDTGAGARISVSGGFLAAAAAAAAAEAEATEAGDDGHEEEDEDGAFRSPFVPGGPARSGSLSELLSLVRVEEVCCLTGGRAGAGGGAKADGGLWGLCGIGPVGGTCNGTEGQACAGLSPQPAVMRLLPRVLPLPPPPSPSGTTGPPSTSTATATPAPAPATTLRALVAFPAGAVPQPARRDGADPRQEEEEEEEGAAQQEAGQVDGAAAATPPALKHELEVLVRSGGAYLPARVAACRLVRPSVAELVGGYRDGGPQRGPRCAEEEEEAEAAAWVPADAVYCEYEVELLSPAAQPGAVLVEFRFGTAAAAGHGGGDAQLRSPSRPRGVPVTVPLLATHDAGLAAEVEAAAAAWPAVGEAAAELDELMYDLGTWAAVTEGGSGAGAWRHLPGAVDTEGAASAGASCFGGVAMWAPMGQHLLAFAEEAGLAATAARIRADLRRSGAALPAAPAAADASKAVCAPRAAASGTAMQGSVQGAGTGAEPALASACGAAAAPAGCEAVGGGAACSSAGGLHVGASGSGRCGGGWGGDVGHGSGLDAGCGKPVRQGGDSAAAGSCGSEQPCRQSPWRAEWLPALRRATGLARAPAAEAAAFRAFTNAWAVRLSRSANAVDGLMLLVLLARGFQAGQAALSAEGGVLMLGLLTGAAASAAALLLPAAASARLAGAARLPRYCGYVASKALLVLGRVPPPSGAAAYAGGLGILLHEGLILPGTCLVSPPAVLLLACLKLPLNLAAGLWTGAFASPLAAGLMATAIEVAALATSLACHTYLRVAFQRRAAQAAAGAAACGGGMGAGSAGKGARAGGGGGSKGSEADFVDAGVSAR